MGVLLVILLYFSSSSSTVLSHQSQVHLAGLFLPPTSTSYALCISLRYFKHLKIFIIYFMYTDITCKFVCVPCVCLVFEEPEEGL